MQVAGICSASTSPIVAPTPHDHSRANSGNSILDIRTVWLYSFISVTIITLISLIGLVLVPLLIHHPAVAEIVVAFLIALSIGTLLGDAILHLLPEVFGAHSHGPSSHSSHDHESHDKGHEHEFVYFGLMVLAGIYSFWLLERGIGHFHHGHAHSHDESVTVPELLSDTDKDLSETLLDGERRKSVLLHPEHSHPHVAPAGRIRTVGWLVLFGDGLHNFVDGLAIGVSFATSLETGISTSVAVLLHEIPHELGDFAVLLNSGFTKWRACLYNLLSNAVAYLGMIAGVLISQYGGAGDDTQVKKWVLAFTAGNFLFISLADLVPELMHDHSQGAALTHSHSHGSDLFKPIHSPISPRRRALYKSIVQNLGMLAGFASMALIALYGEDMLGAHSHS